MLPAAFERAKTDLRGVIHSALVLEAVGGSAHHLVEAIAYGADIAGVDEATVVQMIAEERSKLRGA